MIRLDKLIIRKLGNIAPNTELRFGKRGALLLGKNGTGKTTLLNVIVAVLKSDWDALDAMSPEGFDLEYELTIDEAIRVSVSYHQQPFDPRAYLEPSRKEKDWTWHLEAIEGDAQLAISSTQDSSSIIGIDGRRGPPIQPPVRSLVDAFFPREETLAFTEGSTREEFPTNLAQTIARISRHDESLDYLRRLTSRETPDDEVRFFTSGALANGPAWASSLFSTDTVKLLRKQIGTNSDPITLTFVNSATSNTSSDAQGGHTLQWAQDFIRLCSINDAKLSVRLRKREKTGEMTISRYGDLRIQYTAGNTTLTEENLSYGQKRLFSILHYLDANPDIVVADELVNGLHYDWIERCFEILGERQAFLSSQNPILFDFMYFDSAEDAAERFIECSLDDQGRFVWRNLTSEDATEFYEAYQTGIQHVSEILRSRGYW